VPSPLTIRRATLNDVDTAQDRAWAGRGIGQMLLDWASAQVAASGRKWLRLDCMRGNTKLHAYYQRLGFTHLGDVDLPHRTSGSLFQRRAYGADPNRSATPSFPKRPSSPAV
jgi:hypothetical protein